MKSAVNIYAFASVLFQVNNSRFLLTSTSGYTLLTFLN